MKTLLQQWKESNRTKLQSNTLTAIGLDQLEDLTTERHQAILDLSSHSTNLRPPSRPGSSTTPHNPTPPNFPRKTRPTAPYWKPSPTADVSCNSPSPSSTNTRNLKTTT